MSRDFHEPVTTSGERVPTRRGSEPAGAQLQPTVARRAGDRLETEADDAAEQVARGGSVEALSAVGTVASGGTIVDGPAAQGSGQIGRAEFVAALETRLCTVLDEELPGSGSAGCPDLLRYVRSYAARPAAELERAIRTWTSPRGTGAEALLEAVAERVRGAARAYRASGRIGITGREAGAGLATSSPVQRKTAGVPGAATATPGPLGAGAPLPGAARARMERSFGRSLGEVRIHADTAASGLADRLGARAFTVGRDIGFGAGEFRPDTIEGEALLAHELAHTVQQAGGASDQAQLEQDADAAAYGTVATGRAAVRARTGLSLQRCSKDVKKIQEVRGTIFAGLEDPDASADKIVAALDDLGGDAPGAVRQYAKDPGILAAFARHEGGRRVLARMKSALADGDIEDRNIHAPAVQAVLDRYAAPAATPRPDERSAIDRINAAIAAETPERRALYARSPQPLRFPVRLYERGREEAGGVYYDPSMPKLGTSGAGEAGVTYTEFPSRTTPEGVTTTKFVAGYIRLGPRALESDAYLRSSLYHEYLHYRLQLERREPVVDPDLAQLRSDVMAKPKAPNADADEDLELTSKQVVDDFDRLGDSDIASILWYWGDQRAAGSQRFRNRTLARLVEFAKADDARRLRLLKIIAAQGQERRRLLEPLRAALGALRPKRQRRGGGGP